jgi:DNA polymerase
MKRPDVDMPAEVVEALTEATLADVLDLVHGEPMRCLANIVRGCIIAPHRKKLTIADLANIEGRKLAWLAGEDWKTAAFRAYDAGTGPDLYILAFARAFNVDPKDVGKGYKRQIGKVMELGLGYQGGVGAFLTFAAVYNMDLEELARAVRASVSEQVWSQGEGMYAWTVKKKRSTFGLPQEVFVACQVLVTMWREAHPATVALWAEAEAACVKAVQMPGVPFDVGQFIKVQRDGAWTRVRLPSGRCVCYLHMQHDERGLSFQGINQYTRQWARIRTYGGKLVENWDQASSRDVLAYEMPAIDAAGYEIVLSVHDELLTETPDTDDFSWQQLAGMMARPKPWAPGLPLSAAGFETHRYRKD